jgi:hypothetical protein
VVVRKPGCRRQLQDQPPDGRPFSSTAPGVDLLLYTPDGAKSLVFGVNVQDLSGAQYKLDLEEDTVDRTILMGAGYTKRFDNGSALRLMLQYDMPERADARFHAGAEYAFSKFLALRAGFDDDTATFGLGVGAFDYGLDIAYYSKDEAGSTQAYAFTGAWGQTLDEKREEIARTRAEEERLIQKTFDARVSDARGERDGGPGRLFGRVGAVASRARVRPRRPRSGRRRRRSARALAARAGGRGARRGESSRDSYALRDRIGPLQ